MHGTSGKVLGVFLGPGGYEKSWSAPLQKYMSRVRHVRSLRLGLTQRRASHGNKRIADSHRVP
eukprot:5229524-Pyramimonas_sp.AAC.1